MSCRRHSSIGNEIIMTDVDKVKDLIRIIKESKNSNDEQVDKIMKVYHRSQQRIVDFVKGHFMHANNITDFLPKFVHLTRECVLTHEWTSALRIVHALVNEANRVPHTVWKVGLTCLILEQKPNLMEQFIRQLYTLSKLTCVEVLLDYQLYLLTQGDLKRAEDLSYDLKVYHFHVTREGKNIYRENARILFYGYQGLTFYLKWKAGVIEDSQEDQADNFLKLMVSEESIAKSLRLTAERALENFEYVKNVPGVWDIFIVKILEIHKYYSEFQEARKLLKDYSSENPSNPNAHRYLYNFEMEHAEDIENQTESESLRNIVKLDPSNPLAIELYKKFESSDPEIISVLFDYLDFDHCRDDIHVWELLEKHLSKIKEKECFEENEIVRKCWSTRKDWWPACRLDVDNDSSGKMTALKMEVCKYLKNFQQSQKSDQS